MTLPSLSTQKICIHFLCSFLRRMLWQPYRTWIASSARRVVFDALYFPELISEAYKSAIKAYPVIQFLVYRFLTPAGIYSPLKLIPPHLAKIQHCPIYI
jgi:hypothetical protein